MATLRARLAYLAYRGKRRRNVAPENTVLPSHDGTAPVIGTQITGVAGSWSNADSIAHQWYRGGVAISGATSIDYTPVDADFGLTLTRVETAQPGDVTAESAATGTVALADAGPLAVGQTFGSELVLNSSMEAGSPPSNWTAGANTTLTSEAEERTGGSGTKCLQVENTAAAQATATQSVAIIVGTWYAFLPWQRLVTGNSGTRASNIGTLNTSHGDSTGTWTGKPGTGRATSTSSTITLRNTQSILGRTSRFDDVSLKAINRASMFEVFNVGVVDCVASVKMTRLELTQTGLAHYVDADNFVIAYLNGAGNLELVKYVAGTPSALASVAATYVAGTALILSRSGNNYTVTYNGTQLIAPTAIADAVFATATKWGAFSTWHENTLADLTIAAN